VIIVIIMMIPFLVKYFGFLSFESFSGCFSYICIKVKISYVFVEVDL
jgi:hypothetical protein